MNTENEVVENIEKEANLLLEKIFHEITTYTMPQRTTRVNVVVSFGRWLKMKSTKRRGFSGKSRRGHIRFHHVGEMTIEK